MVVFAVGAVNGGGEDAEGKGFVPQRRGGAEKWELETGSFPPGSTESRPTASRWEFFGDGPGGFWRLGGHP